MSGQTSRKRTRDASDTPERGSLATKKGKTSYFETLTEHMSKGVVEDVEVGRPGPRLIHVMLYDDNLQTIGYIIVPPELYRKKLYIGIRLGEGLWVKYHMPGFNVIDVGYRRDGMGEDGPLVPRLYNFDD